MLAESCGAVQPLPGGSSRSQQSTYYREFDEGARESGDVYSGSTVELF